LGTVASIYAQPLGESQEALASWDRVLALRRQMDDHRGALDALQHMGRLARQRLGDPTRALQYLRQAFALAVELNDRAKEGELLNTLGILEWPRGAYTNALAHYEQALQLYRDLGDMAHAGLM
jgi:tetratricopeptide (TPR) repeat protein